MSATLVQVEGSGGSSTFVIRFFQAMGFRKVADLTDYSTVELLDLISSASAIVRSRVASETSQSQSTPGSEVAASSEVAQATGTVLKNPLTCEFHCRHCNAQCYRVTAHTLHSCAEHKHLR